MATDSTQRKHNQKEISANALTPTLNFQKTLQHCFLRKTIDFKFVPKAHRNWLRRKTFEANKKWFDFFRSGREKTAEMQYKSVTFSRHCMTLQCKSDHRIGS